jgi:hypothetical protein
MKRIAWKEPGYDVEWNILLGVTYEEMAIIEKFFETHDITDLERQWRQWREAFRHQLWALDLDSYLHNRLMSALNYKSPFRDDDDEFLSFEAWAQSVLEGYRRHGTRGHNWPPLSGVRNFGIASYLKLIAALQQWEQNHDNRRT